MSESEGIPNRGDVLGEIPLECGSVLNTHLAVLIHVAAEEAAAGGYDSFLGVGKVGEACLSLEVLHGSVIYKIAVLNLAVLEVTQSED